MTVRKFNPLTVEEIEQVAEGFKDDLTREAKRCVRRKNLEHALAAFAAQEYIDQFVDALRLRAGSELGRPREPKKRIRKVYIPEIVKDAPTRAPRTTEEETQRHAREVAEASRPKGQPKHY